MNNSFGISDEMFIAAMKAAMNQQTKKPFDFDKANPDQGSVAKRMAKTVKASYDAFIEAGFTAEQAFDLVKGIYAARR